MNKKGQLTIFLILGIVVFTIFSLFFYTKAATSGLAVKLPPSFSEVDIYVTSCLKESVENITSPLEPIDELALDIGLDLIDPIKLKLSSCLDLSIFENYDVSGINNPELNIEINE